MDINNFEKWAKNEIDYLKMSASKENREKISNLCYNAYFILLSLCKSLEDERHEVSFEELRDTFLDLLYGRVLTPIEDISKVWTRVHENNGQIIYQCLRYPSLCKLVDVTTNEVRYSDQNRYVCININDPNDIWTGGIGGGILDEVLPIQFPYKPEDTPIKVYIEKFLYHKKEWSKSTDWDTIGITYIQRPGEPPLQVYRFFKDNGCKDPNIPTIALESQQLHSDEIYTPEIIEITKAEYFSRKAAVEKRDLNKLKKDS